ncbi:MAG: FAD-dependent oxidoreductase [Burkholderiaceae bacterium]
MTGRIPGQAEVVIVGGGIVGCSIAYHLARLGITDVVLLERRQLTCGTTWHAAGLVAQLRASRPLTELAKYSMELLRELEEETGQATGFKQNGSLSIALNEARFEELRRGASMARAFGVEVDIVGRDDILSKYPHLSGDSLVGGVWLPNDGQTNPVDTTLAFSRGAKKRGASVLEGVAVDKILTRSGRATGVSVRDVGRNGERESTAEPQEILASTVVVAAGMWSHELARPLGVRLPLHAAEHFYVVTEAIAGLPNNLPVLRVPDEWAYYKEDAGKLLIGAFEPQSKPWGMNGIDRDFCFDSLPDDFDHFEPVLEKAITRVPILASTGIATWFNGPESFTPDDQYLLGETAEVSDLFVACGFNSIGIQSSGGAGKVLAQWIKDRRVPADIPGLEVRRMHPVQGTRQYLHDRTRESLGLLYGMHWPYRQFETARGLRRSPFHDRLIAAGACMGEAVGWERPNWFDDPGSTPRYEYSWGHQNWSQRAREESIAVRDRVALFDQSSMAKFLVQGSDATRILNRISTADVDVPAGRIVYTQWLNVNGGIEADLTITRVDQDEYLVVTSVGSHIRDLTHLRENIGKSDHCFVTDITPGLPMLGLMGPRSRDLLAELSGEDLSTEKFPFGASREIEIGYAIVRASRITYVGELGWELYIPADTAVHVFDQIMRVGEHYGLSLAGMHAMNACRTEKGYRHWGHDIGVDDTPVHAGLSFTCAFGKPGGFIGDEAVLKFKDSAPLNRRLIQIQLQDRDKLCFHEEPIVANDKIVGTVSSGMYGYRMDASLAMGYISLPEPVTNNFLATAKVEVEIAGQRIPATAQLGPWYDPSMKRVKL